MKTIEVKDLQQPFDIGIVLTGFSDNYSQRPNMPDFYYFSGNGSNRLMQAVELYQMGKIKKILISGGASTLVGDKISEAKATANFLYRLGIPTEDVLIEDTSRNTFENAVFCKNVLEKKKSNNVNVLLLTSAFHMKRAYGCFKKAGLKVTPFSIDYYQRKRDFSPTDLIPSHAAFESWQLLVKEWVGILAYKIKGYI